MSIKRWTERLVRGYAIFLQSLRKWQIGGFWSNPEISPKRKCVSDIADIIKVTRDIIALHDDFLCVILVVGMLLNTFSRFFNLQSDVS